MFSIGTGFVQKVTSHNLIQPKFLVEQMNGLFSSIEVEIAMNLKLLNFYSDSEKIVKFGKIFFNGIVV